jgi:MFS family permease
MATQLLPLALFAPLGGQLAARFGNRRWMIMADLARCGLTAAIPTLQLNGVLNLEGLLLIVFVAGMFGAPYLAAQQAIVGDVIGQDEARLGQSTSLLQGAVRLAGMLGSPMAAGLVAVLGAPGVLYINAAAYAASASIVLWFVPGGCRPSDNGSLRFSGTVRLLLRDRLLSFWTLGTFLTEAAWQAIFVAVPILVVSRYHGDVTIVGMVFGAFGIGALLGSFAAVWAVKRFPLVPLATLGKVVQGLTFCLLLIGLTPVSLAVCLLTAGLFNGMSNGPAAAVRLLRIPIEARTQVLSLTSAMSQLGGSFGLAACGFAFTLFGESATIHGIVATQCIGFILFAVGSSAWQRLPDSHGKRRLETDNATE